jgi:hypothetical protein
MEYAILYVEREMERERKKREREREREREKSCKFGKFFSYLRPNVPFAIFPEVK